jgi:hypothetical protein
MWRNNAEELARAEQVVNDLIVAGNGQIGPALLVAYQTECRLRAWEQEQWARKQRRLRSYGGSCIVRPWQLPLEYAWRDLPIRGPHRNQYTGICYCKNGHELTPENTYVRPDGTGRICRRCNAERTRRRRARRMPRCNRTSE